MLISTIVIILVGIFPFLLWWKEYSLELLVAFSISLINVGVGYYLAIFSIDKPNSEFYKNVYGGMLIRMAAVFGFCIYFISKKIVMMKPFMLFFLFFYTLHQWIEISGWLKELPNRKAQLN